MQIIITYLIRFLNIGGAYAPSMFGAPVNKLKTTFILWHEFASILSIIQLGKKGLHNNSNKKSSFVNLYV